MRIALFVHCFFPDHFYGTEKYTLDLARHYRTLGHDVTVVSARFQGESRQSNLLVRYDYGGIPVVCIDKNFVPHTRIKETYYQIDMRPVLEMLLEDIRPDLVHVTHLINHTAVLLEAVRSLGIPAYATFTDFFGFCLNNKLEGADGELCGGPSKSRRNCLACHLKDAARGWPAGSLPGTLGKVLSAKTMAVGVDLARRLPPWRRGALDGLVEDVVKRPDILTSLYNGTYETAIAPTKFLSDAYRKNGFGINLHKVWFGVDIDRSPKPLRQSGHTPVVGFIGQIAAHKGVDLLVDAFCRLQRGSARLRIYGPEDQDPEYMANLKQLAAGSDVEFKGTFKNDDMVEVLRDLDLLVIPSRWYENSPLVLLNALATHTPVLVSDVPGMTEFVAPGESGDVFERGSVDSLHERLTLLLGERGRLQALSSSTNFERDTALMAKETAACYRLS